MAEIRSMVRLSIIAASLLSILASCRTRGQSDSELAAGANRQDVCGQAERELTRQAFGSIGRRWSNCQLIRVADQANDPNGFGYIEKVSPVDLCVIEYSDADKWPYRFIYDRGNSVSGRLPCLADEDENKKRFIDSTGSASDVFHWRKPYDVLSVVEWKADGGNRIKVTVDRQYLGVRRANLYVYEANCTEIPK
jgi:hypothetical protein